MKASVVCSAAMLALTVEDIRATKVARSPAMAEAYLRTRICGKDTAGADAYCGTSRLPIHVTTIRKIVASRRASASVSMIGERC